MTTLRRLFVLLPLFLGMPIRAETSPEVAVDPEATLRVARISYIEGQVTTERTSDEDWVEAILNMPLMEGDKLYTGVGARAEVELEDEVVLRLDEDSFIHLERLDPAQTRIGIVQGRVAFNARAVDYFRPWVAINTPSATAYIVEHAKVRVQVDADGSSEFRVRRGTIDIETGPQRVRRVGPMEKLLAHGPDIYIAAPLTEEDEFDRWCDLRDAQNATSVSRDYVSTRVSGYSDLDRYGDWLIVEDYGRVWRPRVTIVDWAPYQQGRWIWRSRCGWVWVADEPWGWVPYHYGRWVYVDRHRWCWVPHEVVIVERPVWFPALVAFTYADRGSYFRFSIGGGYYAGPCVGWFPLGPRDPYYGWYWYDIHRHRRHRRDHRDDRHRYQNQYVAHAVSVVPREDFGRARYERRGQATLTLADASDIRVGSEARRTIEQELFRPPRVDPSDRKTHAAPRVASLRVAKKAPTRSREREVDARPPALDRSERLSPPTRPAPPAARPEGPRIPSEPRAPERTTRELDTERGPRISNIPREPRSPRDEPRTDRAPRPDIAVRSQPRDSYRPAPEAPEVRYTPPRREPSWYTYRPPEPRPYSRPSINEQTDEDRTNSYRQETRTYVSPERQPEPRVRRSSSSSDIQPARSRPAAPRREVAPDSSSPRSTRPARATSPSVQRPSASASQQRSTRPATAPEPAPNSRSSRGRR